MSRTKNGATRCDWCGKLTRSKDGEYLKPDGVSAGYIVQPEWLRFPGGDPTQPNIPTELDICEECFEARCPLCGDTSCEHPR